MADRLGQNDGSFHRDNDTVRGSSLQDQIGTSEEEAWRDIRRKSSQRTRFVGLFISAKS
jgi:hypothetical protein